ncbi:MAG: OmpA family protein [Myxococcota bacterium]
MKHGAIVAFLGLGLGCSTVPKMEAELDSVARQVERVRDGDGIRCAPVQMAVTDAEVAFARVELDQGNTLRAAQHRQQASRGLDRMQAAIEACPPPDIDGDGVPDREDECPELPGEIPLLGCPDLDRDGIADLLDACREEPEDMDGYEDEDGCPEENDVDRDGVAGVADACPTVFGPAGNQGCPYGDQDGDGLTDAKDQCVDEPEDFDGFEDGDGCPDEGSMVRLDAAAGKIQIEQKVFFRRSRARISRRSYPLLDQVAQVLRENPSIEVLIEGHTDGTGSNSVNLRLSQARAEAVRRFLVRRGDIDPNRLTAIGFGEEKPIANNRTAAGRELNRRVEFTIAER